MVKILYGVSGDGMGHATRSKVVIDHLRKKHEVKIAAGDRAYDYLSQYFKVERIFALRIMYEDNKVNELKTVAYNLRKYPKGRKESMDKIYKLVVDYKPDIIITDFEYFTSHTALQLKIPYISIDNNHILNKCKVEVPKSEFGYYLNARIVSDSIARKADHYFITTFFYPETKQDNVTLVPLILRPEIKKLKSASGGPIFVYQTSETYEELLPTLKKINKRFIVYGLNKGGEDENVSFRRFNEKQFYEDIRTCEAVITNGGFTLISEALFLGKPILSVPIRRQFEQICNAIYLQKKGYGEYHKKLSEDIIKKFISKLPTYRKNLKHFKNHDEKEFFNKLDEKIDELNL